MNFDIIGDIADIEIIATGNSIRNIARLKKQYGKGRWRKLKGFAMIQLRNGKNRKAELHWYEAQV